MKKHFMALALLCVAAVASIYLFRGCMLVYTNASLKGDYLFIMDEVHMGESDGDGKAQVIYVEVAGTMSFDGAGHCVMKDLRIRSSEDGQTIYPPNNGEQDVYHVNDDGSFTLGSPESKMLHGQIVLDDSCLLMDGTLLGTGTDPDVVSLYLNHAIAMKRNITPRNQPTYSNRDLNGEYLLMSTQATCSNYCETFGTVTFNGEGTLTATTTERVTDGVTVENNTNGPETGTYTVNPDGSFSVGGHGQVVLDGNCVLVDWNEGNTSTCDYLDTSIIIKRYIVPRKPSSYDTASIKGDYMFIMYNVNKNNPAGTMTYVETGGLMSFDGAGSVTISLSSRVADGTRITTSSEEPRTGIYTVDPAGTFMISPGGNRPIHGQIAFNGNVLLLDGTGQGMTPAKLLQHGVAARRDISMKR